MSAELPLSDWRSKAPHTADECQLEQCASCGCCVHGKTLATGCRVDLAPTGLRCATWECGCEGRA